MSAPVAPAVLAGLLGEGWRRPGASAHALADALRGLVVDGRLAVRTRVPSERALAPQLGVSRGTVSRAYDRLRGDGYLVSARGAGSWLTLPAGAGPGAPPPVFGGAPARALDLTIAALPAPEPLLGECAARAATALSRYSAMLGCAPAGVGELREAIAARFTERGAPTTADHVLVTAGAQHALHLLLSLLTTPGERVLVDAPSYPRTLSAVRGARARAVPVPLGASGWDVAAWDAAARAVGPRLGLTIPDFHNPTGLTMSAGDRAALAATAARSGMLLVADETNAELRLDGPAMPAPVAASDPGGAVVTIGSMSKSAWGGLRIGWIRAAPRLIRELAAARADVDLAGPVLEQLVAVELLARWDEVLASRRALLRPRRDALVSALAEHAPAWTCRRPRGGLSAWVRLPSPVATRLAAAAAHAGVHITPGPSFTTDGTFEHHIRLPYTRPPDDLARAVQTLSQLATRVGGATAVEDDPAPAAI
ncbi:MAG TPA: PLP-dependent aminotransferase family protein [Baekduia sp.]|uniref:MocR-like transcription factor YczR n=1 Tax=Baekduia sp. TaxID=2600305 RepID=UPI002B7DF35F|nr:PLP-dependent aminotransferase family protein [Baekduia sp.]HMJ33451.1 PLP-dependent aminotransferase family protein [Baekduia sp.]